MDSVTIEAVADLTEEDRKTIIDGLVAYNSERGFEWNPEAVRVIARDSEGRVVGGVLGVVNLRWAFPSAVWVDPAFRGRRLGSKLMREVEVEARRQECIGIFLDTYSFQARPFYERLGFKVFGEIPDFPPGESR